MPEYQIEMLWRCTCKHENRGHDMVCAICGRPRSEKEEFYMPGDTSPDAAVTEPDLLREATAGADWSCRYCRSNQRKLDGTCAQCGASQDEAKKQPPAPAAAARAAEPESEPAPRPHHVPQWQAGAVVALAITLLGLLLYWAFRERTIEATVTALEWEHAVEIERYQVVHHEGWSPSFDAEHVTPLGERFHHLDHVAIGSHDEQYKAKEACGQTCTPIPRTCRQTPKTCTSNKNGYASCRGGDTVCSGGGQSCSTKWCDVTKARSVTDYADIPRTRMWYAWDDWEWGHNRMIKLGGGVPTLRDDGLPWPPPEALLPPHPLADREQERQIRSERYVVTFTGNGVPYTYAPANEEAFFGFTIGQHHTIKVSVVGGVEILPEAGR
jgi:hypothetical protein